MNLLIEETPTHMSIKINRLEEGHNSYPLVCRRPAETVRTTNFDIYVAVLIHITDFKAKRNIFTRMFKCKSNVADLRGQHARVGLIVLVHSTFRLSLH